jgi:hypothetical protein
MENRLANGLVIYLIVPKEVMIGGVNKKVDKKIIFIIKIRGVVEGLYLQIKKHMEANIVINIYFGRLIKC